MLITGAGPDVEVDEVEMEAEGPVKLPILGRGLTEVCPGVDSSHWNPEVDKPEDMEPVERGGRGNKLADLFGDELDDLDALPRSVLDSLRIALGRRRGGVAAAGYTIGASKAGTKACVVGPTDTVDALGRALDMNDPSRRISLLGM
jgi:hypothetical protein